MGKTKDKRAFEQGMGVGVSVWVCQELQRCLGFNAQHFPTTLSRVYGEWSTIQIANLTTVGSTGVNVGQHPCGMLLTPCKVHAPTN
jgi:hypothetical protein